MIDNVEYIEDYCAKVHIVDTIEDICTLGGCTVDGAIETLDTLFTKYPDYINATANFAMPYIRAEIDGDSLPVVRWMVEHGWDPSTFRDGDGNTLLEYVASRGEPHPIFEKSFLHWFDYIHELGKSNPTLLESSHELNVCETAIVVRSEGYQNDTKAWVPVVRKLIQLGYSRPRYSMLKEYCDFEPKTLDCFKDFTD